MHAFSKFPPSEPASKLTLACGPLVRNCRRVILIALGAALTAIATPAISGAQSRPFAAAPQVRITQPIDGAVLKTLKGNVHPLANAKFDRGAASASLPMKRMVMVLKRSDAQDAALKALIDHQQDKRSPSYHQWLTPAALGESYGPAAADVKTVTGWLQSQGFSVSKVSKSEMFIEFSGTAGQVESAFHTSIHSYLVNGALHHANATDPSIPAALAPVVSGIASLNNFPRRALNHIYGEVQRDKATGKYTQVKGSKPAFTFSSGGNTNYAVGPTDLATIYNIAPLWASNVPLDGTGQTVAIAGRTNIDPNDDYNFRTIFGLPTGGSLAAFQQQYLNIIVDGPDPGNLGGDEESEANVDVQWSGAVAKGALIDFVVSQSTETTPGEDLSSLYIIDNNIAPVMSYSFGTCELFLGTSGNQFLNSLWEQAAAQGISVFVASGDSGSATCDDGSGAPAQDGYSVSGNSTTPFNVAVGGTDFDQIDNNPSSFWGTANGATTQASALGYIPETTWNNSCTNAAFSSVTGSTDPLTNCNDSTVGTDDNGLIPTGGSGGPSNCIQSDGSNLSSCQGGYAKPSWQFVNNSGFDSDRVRDVPDISLFASNGFSSSFYIICQADQNTDGQSCNLNSPYADFVGIGGTSVASPAVAGIFGILNQNLGVRVGNPNYALYNLAALEGATNCDSSTGPTSSCIFNDVTKGTISQPCVANSQDCLSASGENYGVLGTDDGSGYNTIDSSGYPSDLAFNTGPGYDYATGLGSINAYNLVTQWTNANFIASGTTLALSATNITHGSSVNATVTVTATTGTPSGDVSFNGLTTNGSIGYVTLTNGTVTTQLSTLPGGSYNVVAHYGGNNDGTNIFGGSDSNPVAVTVSPEASVVTVSTPVFVPGSGFATLTSAPYGSAIWPRVDVTGVSGADPVGGSSATGTVTLTANGTAIPGSPLPLNSQGFAEVQNFAPSPATYTFAASYSGDASFTTGAGTAAFTVTQATPAPTLTSSASSIGSGASVTLTAILDTTTYTGAGPTGTVSFSSGGTALGAPVAVVSGTDANGFPTATAVLTTTTLPTGSNNITGVYSGDTNYATVTTPAVTVTVTTATGGFGFTPAPTAATASSPGQGATSTISVTPTNYTGTINFTCTLTTSPTGAVATYNPTCTVPSLQITKAGVATTTATFATTAPSTTAALIVPETRHWYTAAGGAALAFVLFFGIPARRKGWRAMLGLLVFLVGMAGIGCGGGGGGNNTGTPGTTTGTYTFTVTGTDSVTSALTATATVTLTVQ